MADRPAARRPSPEPGREPARAPEPPDETGPEPASGNRPLSDRWWWSGVATALVGGVLIGFQWEVVGTGDAIPANWVLVAVGAVIVGAGLVILWRDWRRHSAG